MPLTVLVGCITLIAQLVSRFGERLENGDDQRMDGHQQMLSQLATFIDQPEIRWPTSGQVQTFQNVPVNVCLEIQENMQGYRKVYLPIISYPGK